MRLSRTVLSNPHAVWAAIIAAFIFGVVGYLELPVRLFPDTAPPLVNVVTPWPGAAAADVERDLSRVLEEEFASLEGVAILSATSQDNLSMVSVEFQYDVSSDLAAVDVQNAIARIGGDLPSGAEQPRVMTFSTSDRPVYTVGLVADDRVRARRLAEDVFAPQLQRLEGVAAVDVFGGGVPGVLVEVDPRAAEAHRLALPAIAQAIATTNTSLPAGRLRTAELETMLRVDQRVDRAEMLEELTLEVPGEAQVHLDNLATVTRASLDDESVFSIDGQRAIALQVFASEDANTIEVVNRVQAEIERAARSHPDIRFVPGEESASFTEQSVSNLLGNVGQALVLASVILFLFLGRVRSSMVTILSMPLSYAITFGAMNALDMELNMVTLSAVILAVGMVVDATVVVLENIIRLREERGLAPVEAAIQGADEVALPVLAGAATTMIVLLPLLGLEGFVGKTFGPLAATLLIAFTSSVLVALVAVPVASQYARDGGRLDRSAGRIAAPFQRATDALRRGYMALLDLGLRRPFAIVLVAAMSFLLGLFGLRSAGMEMLPRMDSGTFSVSLETPSGSSLAHTAATVAEVEEMILEHPEVSLVQARAGYEPGMLYTGGAGVMGSTQGFLSVTLTPRTERDSTIWQIEDEIRVGLARIPGLTNAVVEEVGNTAKATTAAPVIARLSGPDPRVLDHLGDEVRERLGEVEGIVAPTRVWNRDMERVTLRIDEQRALSLGHGVVSVARSLAAGAEGIRAGSYDPGEGSPEPIVVRYQRSADPDLDELLSWPLFVAASGQVLPLRSVAHAERSDEQGLFTSRNLSPTLDVLAGVAGRPLSFVVADAEAAVADQTVPEGYSLEIAGENSDMQDARGQILGALGVSVIAVYLLLAAQFRSFVHPLTVMMAVPLSLVGVSAALFAAGKPVSMPVMVGLVLLVGIVVNNSILLVDVIRQRRAEGVERLDAIRQGVNTRFRPILMTSLSTMVGMLPLAMEWALGAERFSPLAIAVIGGLLASTLLTLVVIPVLYELSERMVQRLRRPSTGQGVAIVALAAGLACSSPVQANELTLDEAWGMLAVSHPAMEAAGARLESAEASAAAATSRMLPEAQLSSRYSRLSYVEPATFEIPIELPTGDSIEPIQLGEAVQNQYSLRLAAQQPLFAGGSLVQARRAAKASAERARAEKDVTAASLWFSLVESWYGLAVARNLEHIQADLLAAAVAQEQRLERLFEQDRVTELQRARGALARADAQQALAEARASVELAEHRLSLLLGRAAPAALDDPVAAAQRVAEPEAADPSHRPEVSATAAGVRAAEAVARGKVGALAPSLALSAGYQYENPNARYFPVEEEWNDSWDASVVLTWNLDAGLRLNEARAARADAEAARAGLRALIDETRLQQERAALEVRQWTAQLALAEERVRLAERAAQAAETALQSGRLTSEDYLEREADVALAEAARQRVALALILARERHRGLAGAFGPRGSAE